LFGDIADAIRFKTGEPETVKIKPIDFPTLIRGIASSTGGYSVNSGSFTPEADRTVHTIEHGLGVVPNLIVVSIGKAINESEMANHYGAIYGGFLFSSAFLQRMPEERRASFGAWWGWVGGDFGFLSSGNSSGLDATESYFSKHYGQIRNGNSQTFQVGGTGETHMPSGITYNWCALAGIL
jgi:hypothetical protein